MPAVTRPDARGAAADASVSAIVAGLRGGGSDTLGDGTGGKRSGEACDPHEGMQMRSKEYKVFSGLLCPSV